MNDRIFNVHIEEAEEGGYIVMVPSLPECVTQGETYQEALVMARDAIRCALESRIKAGEAIPEDVPRKEVALEVSNLAFSS